MSDRGSGDEEEWEDDEDVHEIPSDDDLPPLLCFFCPHVTTRLIKAQHHMLQEHQFDLANTTAQFKISDDYEFIRFINFIRKEALSPDFRPRLLAKEWSNEDSWLRPSLATDAFLSLDIEDLLAEAGSRPGPSDQTAVCGSPEELPLAQRMRMVETRAFRAEEELAEAQRELAAMRRCMRRIVSDDEQIGSSPSSASRPPNGPLSPSVEPATAADDAAAEGDEEDVPGLISNTPHSSDSLPLPPDGPGSRIIFARHRSGPVALTDGYFESYDRPSIHEEMLQDRVRTESYRAFILGNAERLFAGKRVLDLGCGTGILSMMAARAGAAAVHAVDKSDMIFTAMEIARDNGLQDQITFHHGRVEDIYFEFGKVDVVISEWMGYFLLFESMLDSVLFCRERLSPKPLLFPRFYRLLLVGLDDPGLAQEKVRCWDDFYGFKMTALRRQVLAEASVRSVPGAAVATDACEISLIDLDTCGLDWQLKDAKVSLTVHSEKPEVEICAVAGYFDTSFEEDDRCDRNVHFSTGPLSPVTHWKQTVFMLKEPISAKNGDFITGSMSVERSNDDMRALSISLQLQTPAGALLRQKFTMD